MKGKNQSAIDLGEHSLKIVKPPQTPKIDGQVITHSDLVAGKYQGGFKIWEGSKDLVEYLTLNPVSSHLEILEVGCGHGLPGIYCACEFMPKRVVLQDFNEEVIERVSKPNIELNQSKIHLHCQIQYVTGDWKDDQLKNYGTFNLILSCETLYNKENYKSLYNLISRRLKEEGEVLMCQKLFYYGVGGGVDEWEGYVNLRGEFKIERLKTIQGSAGSSVRCIIRMKRQESKGEAKEEIDYSDLFPNTVG